MKIKIGNYPTELIADSDQLLAKLDKAFSQQAKIVLENKKDESIWAWGSAEKLVIGFSDSEGEKMISLSKREQSIIPFSISNTTLQIQKNDLMMAEDAKMLFSCFFSEQPFPDAYNFRNR